MVVRQQELRKAPFSFLPATWNLWSGFLGCYVSSCPIFCFLDSFMFLGSSCATLRRLKRTVVCVCEERLKRWRHSLETVWWASWQGFPYRLNLWAGTAAKSLSVQHRGILHFHKGPLSAASLKVLRHAGMGCRGSDQRHRGSPSVPLCPASRPTFCELALLDLTSFVLLQNQTQNPWQKLALWAAPVHNEAPT